MISIHNYYKWYFIPKIKFNIIKYTKNRETALIGYNYHKAKRIPLRMLKVHSVQDIDFHLKAVNWYKTKWNIYYSLAKYKNGIPKQKFNLKDRNNEHWRLNHHKEMIEYDLLIDIDATNHNEIDFAKESTINVVKRFQKYDIPFELRFSGMGFHIVIPYSYFSEKGYNFEHGSRDSIYYAYSLICKKLKLEVSEMIDIKVSDARRLCKLPYSLALYKGNIFVCMPINIEKLKNFELDKYKPEVIIKEL